MARTKPEIVDVWADTGAKIDPNTQYADPDKIKDGWLAEIPFHESENFMANRRDQFLAHINDYGIPQWDNVTEYPDKSWSRSLVDGRVYQSNKVVTAGSTEPSANGTDWDLISTSPTSSTIGIPIDMTNGGANDLNFIEFTHTSEWDDYKRLTIEIEGMTIDANSIFAFIAYENATPSTHLQFVGTSKEAWAPTTGNTSIGEMIDFSCSILSNGLTKIWDDDYLCSDLTDREHGTEGVGYVLDYNGSSYSNSVGIQNWLGWDTGSRTWAGRSFKLQLESGVSFTGGSLVLRGHVL